MYKTDRTIKRLVKHLYSTLILLLLFSCGNEKVLQLPELDHSDITEILDVSPAYLFYDETKPDSIELNRKNLIGSTNWLVNVYQKSFFYKIKSEMLNCTKMKQLRTTLHATTNQLTALVLLSLPIFISTRRNLRTI